MARLRACRHSRYKERASFSECTLPASRLPLLCLPPRSPPSLPSTLAPLPFSPFPSLPPPLSPSRPPPPPPCHTRSESTSAHTHRRRGGLVFGIYYRPDLNLKPKTLNPDRLRPPLCYYRPAPNAKPKTLNPGRWEPHTGGGPRFRELLLPEALNPKP
jgi:hypothetical protein